MLTAQEEARIMAKIRKDSYGITLEQMKQLYKELYKTENIEKFRSIIIPIERNAAA